MCRNLFFKFSALFSVAVFLLSFPVFSENDTVSEDTVSKVCVAAENIISYEKSRHCRYENSYILGSDFFESPTDSEKISLLTSLSRLGLRDNYIDYGCVLKDLALRADKNDDKFDFFDISMGLMACGINPQDIKDGEKRIDLVKDGVWGKSASSPIEKGGAEKLLKSLILLDSYNTLFPEDTEILYTRENIISKIFAYQKKDGSFSSVSSMTDPELTALAITALAPYRFNETEFEFVDSENEKVSQTVGNVLFFALEYLSELWKEDEVFGSFGEDNVKILSEIITALTALGISPDADERFIKNEKTTIDALLSLQNADGSFGKSGSVDSCDTEKLTASALKGFVSYLRFANGQTFYYDFTDCTLNEWNTYSLYFPSLKNAEEFYLNNPVLVSVKDYETLAVLIGKTKNAFLKNNDDAVLKRLEKKADELYSNKKSSMK